MKFSKQLIVARARRIQRFLSQPFFVGEQFTGFPGKYVPLKETIRSFKEILEGKHDDLPESAFLFAGTVSRYALPMLPILVPGAVYVVAKWREFNKTQLKWCFGLYALSLFVGLIAGYIVQKGVAL